MQGMRNAAEGAEKARKCRMMQNNAEQFRIMQIDAGRRRETQTNPEQLQRDIGICRMIRYPRKAQGDPGGRRQTQTDSEKCRICRECRTCRKYRKCRKCRKCGNVGNSENARKSETCRKCRRCRIMMNNVE